MTSTSGRILSLHGADPAPLEALARALLQRLRDQGRPARLLPAPPDALEALNTPQAGAARHILLDDPPPDGSAPPGPALTLLLVQDGGGVGPAGEATEQALRAALARAGQPYGVLRGTPEACLAAAWNAIEFVANSGRNTGACDPFGTQSAPWQWSCETCTDPDCEHRLFRQLLARRGR